VIISTNAMWAIARANPLTTSELNQLEGLGPWRRQAYGEDIIETLGNR
jgi:ribonuclease D